MPNKTTGYEENGGKEVKKLWKQDEKSEKKESGQRCFVCLTPNKAGATFQEMRTFWWKETCAKEKALKGKRNGQYWIMDGVKGQSVRDDEVRIGRDSASERRFGGKERLAGISIKSISHSILFKRGRCGERFASILVRQEGGGRFSSPFKPFYFY